MKRTGPWLLVALPLLLVPTGPWAGAGSMAPRRALPGVRARTPNTNGPTDRKELETFLDRFFAQHLLSSRPAGEGPAGAAIAVVKDGTILLAKGYGYANLAHREPVRPGRSLFRLCSVSKVVTATAVMQLVERGKLRLNDDVNRYLTRFKLPNTFSQPVTPANLLTHTGGFDELHIGRSTLSASALRPLGSYLADRMPPRVVPPGEVYSYSDHGYALAGYLVEAVSGVPFARYVDQHIFRPLGMRHSSFQQPLPARLASDMATGYDIGGGVSHPAPMEYFNTAPAAAMWTTATDMAHFMIAQLSRGLYGRGRILEAPTVREMQQEQFSSYPHLQGFPPMPGVAYGFGIYYQNGLRILNHSGTLRGFSSLLLLLPEKNLGVFVAGNSSHDAYLSDLQREFIDHYFPAAEPRSAGTHGGAGRRPWLDPRFPISRFAGSYWSTEYSRRTIEKLRQLLNQVQVTATGNASLTARYWDGRTVRLIRVAPLLFETVDAGPVSYWAFQEDAAGRITHMVPGGLEVFDRIAWYETTGLQVDLIGALILIFLSGCIVWLIAPPIRSLRRRSQGLRPRERSPELRFQTAARTAHWVAALSSTLNLFFLVPFLLLMQSAASTQDLHYSWIEYGVPPGVIALLCVPPATTALAVTMPAFTVLAWKNSCWPVLTRLHYTLLTLGALALVPFLLYWNLFGFHY